MNTNYLKLEFKYLKSKIDDKRIFYICTWMK